MEGRKPILGMLIKEFIAMGHWGSICRGLQETAPELSRLRAQLLGY